VNDIVRDLWRSAKRDRMRMLLTLSGIVLGAAAIVFLASALSGANVMLTRMNQAETGDDMSHVRAQNAPLRSAAQTFRELTGKDSAAMAKKEGLGRDRISGGNWTEHVLASKRGKTMYTGVQSGDPNWAELGGFTIMHGRYLREDEGNLRTAVIGCDLWRELFDGKWPLEDNTFQIYNSATLHVVGVMKCRPPLEGGGGDGSGLHDRRTWITTTTFARTMRTAAPLDEIIIKHPMQGDELPDLKAVAARLTPFLETLHLGVKNFEFEALNQGFQLWNLMTWALGAIMFGCGLVSMFVGAVNVMNSQLMAFGERTKEFGLRRALGESVRQLQMRVAIEAGILALVGGAAGVVFGTLAALGLSKGLVAMDVEWPFRLVPWSILAALVLSFISGIGAGLVPALRASRLMPSEALRAD
jgi:ABC-type antimicrobial peptide transport system permease subunit